jgi:predicted ABC-type ATPase
MLVGKSNVIIVAGPNGSGKSTAAPALLRDFLQVDEFVNADVIAQGLSAFQPEKEAIRAGRIMLKRIHYLAEMRSNFAFETTLASRTFATWISKLKKNNYQFHLVFLWLRDVDLAVSRVKERVILGGHSIPEETIRRRYHSGIRNFLNLYRPLSDSWKFYDNSRVNNLSLIASSTEGEVTIENKMVWEQLREHYSEQ